MLPTTGEHAFLLEHTCRHRSKTVRLLPELIKYQEWSSQMTAKVNYEWVPYQNEHSFSNTHQLRNDTLQDLTRHTCEVHFQHGFQLLVNLHLICRCRSWNRTMVIDTLSSWGCSKGKVWFLVCTSSLHYPVITTHTHTHNVLSWQTGYAYLKTHYFQECRSVCHYTFLYIPDQTIHLCMLSNSFETAQSAPHWLIKTRDVTDVKWWCWTGCKIEITNVTEPMCQ